MKSFIKDICAMPNSSIKQLRTDLDLSQDRLANYLHMSRNTYIALENWTRWFKKNEKELLAKFYDIQPSSFDEHEFERTHGDRDHSSYKLKQLILYITNKCWQSANLWKVVLNKLLYFSDFDYYEKYDESISESVYIKQPMGPVPQYMDDILDSMQSLDHSIEIMEIPYYGYVQKKVIPFLEPDLSLFSADQIKEVDRVLRQHWEKTWRQLTVYSHWDIPWLSTQEDRWEISYNKVHYRTPEYSVIQGDE